MSTPPRSQCGTGNEGVVWVETEDEEMSERIEGRNRPQGNYLALGIAFGMTVGAALGVTAGILLSSTAMLCVGLGFGVAVGMAVGVVFEERYQQGRP